jgi:hypothetical protein
VSIFWYPNTCSEGLSGCILEQTGAQETLVAIARTCTGHAQTQWGRTVALNMQNPAAAGAGDQGRFNAIVQQNKSAQQEPTGQQALVNKDG